MTVWTLSRHSVLASCADCGELYFPPSLEKSPLHCGEVFTHSALPCNYMSRLSTFKSTRSAACARPSGALTQKRGLLSQIQHMPSARKSEMDLPPQVPKWLGAFCQRHSFAEETENVCGAPRCEFNKLVWDMLRSELHTRGRDAGLSTWNVSMWGKKHNVYQPNQDLQSNSRGGECAHKKHLNTRIITNYLCKLMMEDCNIIYEKIKESTKNSFPLRGDAGQIKSLPRPKENLIHTELKEWFLIQDTQD